MIYNKCSINHSFFDISLFKFSISLEGTSVNCERENDKHVRRVDERLREKQSIVPIDFFVIKNVRNRIAIL